MAGSSPPSGTFICVRNCGLFRSLVGSHGAFQDWRARSICPFRCRPSPRLDTTLGAAREDGNGVRARLAAVDAPSPGLKGLVVHGRVRCHSRRSRTRPAWQQSDGAGPRAEVLNGVGGVVRPGPLNRTDKAGRRCLGDSAVGDRLGHHPQRAMSRRFAAARLSTRGPVVEHDCGVVHLGPRQHASPSLCLPRTPTRCAHAAYATSSGSASSGRTSSQSVDATGASSPYPASSRSTTCVVTSGRARQARPARRTGRP